MKFFSVAEANRQFYKILREVRAGETIVVTSRGQPVAKIVPAGRDSAEARLLERLRSQPALNIPMTWTRGDLYDD